MIATDIDGTLVNDNKEISPKTLAALKAARKKEFFVQAAPLAGLNPTWSNWDLPKTKITLLPITAH